MLPIIWAETAIEDLQGIADYIALDSEAAANSVVDLIVASVEPVATYPFLYRAGRVPGTREIVAHPNYIVVYRVRADTIEVTAVLHARQEYP